MMKRISFIVILCLCLSGCMNANELERMYYVHAIGLDYVDGQFEVHLQLLNFATISSESDTTEAEAETIAGMGVGDTPVTAIHSLYRSTSQTIYWGHLAAVVFTESAMEYGVKELLDDFLRYHEISYTPWIFSTKSDISSVLEVYPILDSSPVLGTLGDPEDSYSQSSFIAPIRKHRFLLELNEPGKSANIPCLVTDSRWHSKDGSEKALHVLGASTLYGETYKGTLEDSKVSGLRWMQSETERTPVIVSRNGEPAAVAMLRHPKHKVIPSYENGELTFNVEIEVGGGIIEMDQNVSVDFIEEEAAKVIEEEVRHTYNEALKNTADIYHFNNAFYKKNPQTWHELTEGEEIALTSDMLASVDVKVSVKHGGKNRLIPVLTEIQQ